MPTQWRTPARGRTQVWPRHPRATCLSPRGGLGTSRRRGLLSGFRSSASRRATPSPRRPTAGRITVARRRERSSGAVSSSSTSVECHRHALTALWAKAEQRSVVGSVLCRGGSGINAMAMNSSFERCGRARDHVARSPYRRVVVGVRRPDRGGSCRVKCQRSNGGGAVSGSALPRSQA
jgi:hypothetical protein